MPRRRSGSWLAMSRARLRQPSRSQLVMLSGKSRILVLGCPGSGKTILARRFARQAGLPLRHLDDEYWGAGWSRPPLAQWEARQRQLAELPRWVIDGNYLDGIPLRAARADLVVVLDLATVVCLRRVVSRAWRIAHGDWTGLPAAVREGPPEAVRATVDFMPLLRKVALFRTRDLWRVILAAHTNPETPVVVAIGPGSARVRTARLRAKAARAGLPTTFLNVAALSRDRPRDSFLNC